MKRWRIRETEKVEKPFTLTFPKGLAARGVWVGRPAELPGALRELGLRPPRPTLALVGGAGGMNEFDLARLRLLFEGALAPLAESLGAFVVDGGTDAGVMRLMGQARARTGAAFPLVGVAATGTVALPGTAPSHPEAASLEPHHTHFVLVPGAKWGDESPWLSRVAGALAAGAPSVTVLVNGGEIARQDVSRSIQAGRPVVVVAGSGRTADTLAAALRGEADDAQAKTLATSGLLRMVDVAISPNAISREIEQVLSERA